MKAYRNKYLPNEGLAKAKAEQNKGWSKAKVRVKQRLNKRKPNSNKGWQKGCRKKGFMGGMVCLRMFVWIFEKMDVKGRKIV